ncbi:MAG: hypothetical protein ACLQAT_00285 [Candidatus Binataceae bacterium]
MKLHIGADKRGVVHTVTATDARAADITQLPHLLHGQEREIFGDLGVLERNRPPTREMLSTWASSMEPRSRRTW